MLPGKYALFTALFSKHFNAPDIHAAFKIGDLDALRRALANPPDFPNCRRPMSIGIVFEYAIYHSPLFFVRTLLKSGADPNYTAHDRFPSLIAALSCSERFDQKELIALLLEFGADIQQRGINDYTPLHYAAATNDVPMVEWLLAHGADPKARTHIDEYATPLEEAESLGKTETAERLQRVQPKEK